MSIYTGRVSEEYKKAYLQKYYLDHRDHLLPKNTLYGREYRRINEAACKEKGMNYYYRHRDRILRNKREKYNAQRKPPPECRTALVGFKTNVTLVFD